MSTFCIRVANHLVAVRGVHPEAQRFFSAFMADGTPEINLSITPGDVSRELLQMGPAAGTRSSAACRAEISAVLRRTAEALVARDIFLFHGAAISVGGQGFIFTGNSGIGKSTHILKWLANYPDTLEINGDKPFIAAGDEPRVFGSPWGGKERFSSSLSAPLKAIILLERAEENHMQPVTLAGLFPRLCQQIYRPDDVEVTRRTLQLLRSLNGTVSFWLFRCNNFREDCFPTVCRALTGREP